MPQGLSAFELDDHTANGRLLPQLWEPNPLLTITVM
jgi:hypothetical protein